MKDDVGEVSRGFCTWVIVIVKLVLALAIESKFSLIDELELIEHLDAIPEVVREQVELVVLIEVYAGKVITMNDPEISLLTVTNHKL